MKTVLKNVNDENLEVRKLMRQLFELQIKFEELNDQSNDYGPQVQIICETLDALFETMICSG